MTTQRYHIPFTILFVIAFALTGCGKSTPQAPPKQQVQDAIRTILPPFLSLDSVELEPIGTGPETVKVNFKALVIPKEDMCQVDREVDGTPKITLLKVVQAAGTKLSLYGLVEARRTMDLWTLESPQIQVGLKQFGEPRGAFGPESYVTGTNEATTALRQQAANAELQRQAQEAAQKQRELEQKALEEKQAREQKARQMREEEARIALEKQRQEEMAQRKKEDEQRQKEQEAVVQKLILATVPATRYIGTLSIHDERQRIRLVFTEQKEFLIRAEVSNPDNAKAKQTFTGELVTDSKTEKAGTAVYPILMSPVGEGPQNLWNVLGNPFGYFYLRGDGHLKLRLTDSGLEGEAQIGGTDVFTIRLQRETPKDRKYTRKPGAHN